MATIKFTIQVNCGVRFDEDDALYVSVCPSLGVYSQGESEEEALNAIKSAVKLHLSAAFDHNCLDRVIRKAGFAVLDGGDPEKIEQQRLLESEFVHVQVSSEYKPVPIEVPITLLAARQPGYASAC